MTWPLRVSTIGSGPNRSYFNAVLTLTVEVQFARPPVPPTDVRVHCTGVLENTSQVPAPHAGDRNKTAGRPTVAASPSRTTLPIIGTPMYSPDLLVREPTSVGQFAPEGALTHQYARVSGFVDSSKNAHVQRACRAGVRAAGRSR